MSNNQIVKRINSNKLNKKECYICKKYKYITELHHLVTMSDINSILIGVKNNQILNLKYYYSKLNEIVEAIYLCPNHHTLYHKLLSRESVQIAYSLTKKEKEMYFNCLECARNLYREMINMVENLNLDKDILKKIIKVKNKIETTLYILLRI